MKVVLIIVILLFSKKVYAQDLISDSIKDSFMIEEYTTTLDKYLSNEDIEISSMDIYESLLQDKEIQKAGIIKAIINSATNEIKASLKSIASIYLVIIIYMLLNTISIDKNSDTVKIANIIITCVITLILFKNYKEIIDILVNTTRIITYLLELVSTFLTGVLAATGKINSAATIEPIILLVNSAIPLVTNYIIIPMLTISVVIKIVSQIAVEMRLEKISKMFRKSAIYIFSTLCTIFILVISLKSGISKNIDSIYFKTTQNVFKDSVPVVGGIFADSLDTVIGASELIAKTGGTVAIICSLLLIAIPVIKIGTIVFLYNLLIAISEPIDTSGYVIGLIEHFESVYKDVLGIMIGLCVIFLSSTGIIMSVFNSL